MGNQGAGDLNDIQRMQGMLRSKLLSQELSDGETWKKEFAYMNDRSIRV